MAAQNNTFYEYDSDEVILYDVVEEFSKLKHITDFHNKRRVQIARQNKDAYAEMLKMPNSGVDKKKEIMKLYYRSGILESILFQKLLDGDEEGALEYEEKLSEVFVDMDILLSEKMKKEGDYKIMTEKIMADKKGITKIVDMNKCLWAMNDMTDDILKDLGIWESGKRMEFPDFQDGLLCYTY